jgi:EAL domain-containing protein (putative c-di-GMP-specific phosphodiesterase class I)
VGTEPDRGLALYRSVIGLCGTLGLNVIAEGIEAQAQADTVCAAGCRLAKGHPFGRALSITDVSSGLSSVKLPSSECDLPAKSVVHQL